MPDELLGFLFENLGFLEGSEGSNSAEQQTAATSMGSTQEELRPLLENRNKFEKRKYNS